MYSCKSTSKVWNLRCLQCIWILQIIKFFSYKNKWYFLILNWQKPVVKQTQFDQNWLKNLAKQSKHRLTYLTSIRNNWTTWCPPWGPPNLISSVVSSPTNWNSPVLLTLTWLCTSWPVTVYLKVSVSVGKVSPTGWCTLTSNFGEWNLFFFLDLWGFTIPEGLATWFWHRPPWQPKKRRKKRPGSVWRRSV